MEQKLATLKAALAEIADLHATGALLGWDQETYMPDGGAAERAEQLATIYKIAHEKFTADEIGVLLDDLRPLADQLDYDSDDAALLRVTRRDYEKSRKLPTELVVELSRATSHGVEAWKKARATNDFPHFQPFLEKIVDLTIQKGEALGYEENIYDALLDDFEPDMRVSQINPIFQQVKDATVPLVKMIASQPPIDDSFLHQYFDPQKQWEFGLAVVKDYGYDFNRGRQDKSTHPFTTSFGVGDVRITTRILKDYLPSALFSSLHEAGHGLYEQGIAPSLARTPLRDGTSLGVHESQSRMWENVVGRSLGFWQHYYPQLQKLFPDQLGGVALQDFYRAINKVTPSLIRVEADEVTYNLHIFIRFELEQALLAGTLKVADLPAAWNEKYRAYLGITPDSDANGVMQDIHWSSGLLGYFPTYSLGNILSVQFFNKMVADNPAIPAEITAGKFDTVLGWLRENIHRHGRKFTPTELIERVTGGGIDAQPYINYITEKYTAIYG